MILTSNLQNKINFKNLPSILGCLTICFSFLLEVIFLSFWFIFGVTIYLFSLTPHLIRQEIRLALALKYCVSSIPPSPLTLLWSELHPCSSRLLQVACPVSHFIIFNQGPSDPQVSKVLGGHRVLMGDQSPVLDITGAPSTAPSGAWIPDVSADPKLFPLYLTPPTVPPSWGYCED